MNIETLRAKLKESLEIEKISLRNLEGKTGVSFSTLSRFVRGSSLSVPTLETLERYLSGEPITKTKISSKMVKVGSVKFLITIEQIEKAKKL